MADAGFDRPSLETRVVGTLSAPSIERRTAMLAAPPDAATHARLYAETDCLHAVELAQLESLPHEFGHPLTVAFWNVERLPDVANVATLLKSAAADVALLCEVDVGMARTGQLHTIREMAAHLGGSYAVGVEYVELGLGDERERTVFAGQSNLEGLHGAGIVSRSRISRPAVMRLDSTGAWFGPEFGERRVGGRIAVAAQITVRGQPVTFASVHLESNSDPHDRAESTRRLIALIEEYDSSAPVVIGGDFNTSTASLREREDRDAWRTTLRANPTRVLQPEPFEPLFEHFARAGFDWAEANAPLVPTERPDPHEQDDAPLGKIDWFFTRNIHVSAARVIPAVGADGSVISDHDMLLLRIP